MTTRDDFREWIIKVVKATKLRTLLNHPVQGCVLLKYPNSEGMQQITIEATNGPFYYGYFKVTAVSFNGLQRKDECWFLFEPKELNLVQTLATRIDSS